ncbi:MAG TPA: phosphodiester glycosidase family protein [Candidatus Xenobia bacterium]|jgi:hypothetical protein
MTRLPLVALLLMTLAGSAGAVPGLAFERGSFEKTAYAVVRVDPRVRQLDIVTFGRRGPRWMAHARPMAAVPADCLAVMNGTFFSERFQEPLGDLVYGGGKSTWTPLAERWHRAGGRWVRQPIVDLSRWYVAVLSDGQVKLGSTCGLSARVLRGFLELANLQGVRCLMGGCGPLVVDGQAAVDPATLRRADFDAGSGLRESVACPRTALGLTPQGEVLMVTCGLEGGGLSLKQMADLMVSLGAGQAVFLDCDSSTAMRWGKTWSRSSGRPLPTWWVVR